MATPHFYSNPPFSGLFPLSSKIFGTPKWLNFWKGGISNYGVIKIRFLGKVLSKQFCFIRCRRQHLWSIEYRRSSRFTFDENTISNLPKVPRAKFLGSKGLFCFISICKLGSFKNPLATITSVSELYLRIRRFILLVQMNKVIYMNYGSS